MKTEYRISHYSPFSFEIDRYELREIRQQIIELIGKKRKEHVEKYGEIKGEEHWYETQSETTGYYCGWFESE